MGREAVVDGREPTKRIFGCIIREIIERREPSSVLLFEGRGYLKEKVGYALDYEFIIRIESILQKIEKREKIDELEIQLLFFADRCDHVVNVIKPALDSGKCFINDRFDLSTFGHGISAGISLETLCYWHKLSVERLGLRPDLLIFIDIPVEESVRRLREDKDTILDIYEESFVRLRKINDAYEFFLKSGDEWKIFALEVAFIDGTKRVEDVAMEIKRVVCQRIFE
jgi:thymidylate kinase